jgi:anti-sigma B factor antagonist
MVLPAGFRSGRGSWLARNLPGCHQVDWSVQHDCGGAPVRPDGQQTDVSPLIVPEIVVLPDEIDITNASAVGDQLQAALLPGADVIIADMTRTVFCDSSGIRCLLITRDRAAANQSELRIVVESPPVLRTLTITGVDQVLAIYPSLQAALTARPAR